MEQNTHNPVAPGRWPEWLLVIDDERGVCAMVRAGYTDSEVEVEVAENATAARVILSRRESPPVLVLFDGSAPAEGEIAFVRDLATRLPRTKLVLMHQHLREIAQWQPALGHFTFLAKPFRVDQLVALLAAARRQQAG